MIKVIGIGAGGHAKTVLEALQAGGQVEVIGLLSNEPSQAGTRLLGVPVLGDVDRLASLYEQGVRHAFLGVGSTAYPEARIRLFELLVAEGFAVVQVIHPTAAVSRSAALGQGVVVLANAVVGTSAELGDNVIVNSGAVVEHDCQIGDHCHIAPGATVGGSVRVGPNAHIGLGASVIQGLTIGANSVVGAGAAVVADVDEGVVVTGVPARVLRANRMP